MPLSGNAKRGRCGRHRPKHWVESARCVPAYRSHLGFYDDETAVHLDGSRPQDDDSIFVTDQTPKPPSDSDSSGTFARAVENNQAIPGYEVVRKLGSGAMAAVFLARQVSLDRLVAIKILPSRFSANTDYIKRFQQEGKAAAKLNHPNIVAAVDVGAVGRRHYFVMEYVDGTDVHELLKKESKLSERRALEIIQEIALALQHAHGKGFLHRDIKPRNIMITKAGVAKLADLGLARHVDDTETAEAEKNKAFGTPFYISPEQIRGKMDIAAPADIYGLGATFYHMVTGKVPFTGANPKEVMKAHLKQELVLSLIHI